MTSKYPILSPIQEELAVHYLLEQKYKRLQSNTNIDEKEAVLALQTIYNLTNDGERKQKFANLFTESNNLEDVLFYSHLSLVLKFAQDFQKNSSTQISYNKIVQHGINGLFEAITTIESTVENFEQYCINYLSKYIKKQLSDGYQNELSLNRISPAGSSYSDILPDRSNNETYMIERVLSTIEEKLYVCTLEEQSVISLILQGKEISEIGETLQISPDTVEAYIVSAGRKFRDLIL